MVDPDAPSRTNHPFREVRHWLVMNILESAVENGDEISEYRGSGPPKDTGLHRYIFLVFKQPDGLIVHDEPHTSNKLVFEKTINFIQFHDFRFLKFSLDRSRAHRLKTSAMKLAEKYNLGNPEFGNFYQAQYDAYVDILQAQTVE